MASPIKFIPFPVELCKFRPFKTKTEYKCSLFLEEVKLPDELHVWWSEATHVSRGMQTGSGHGSLEITRATIPKRKFNAHSWENLEIQSQREEME